jgi:hypothetical protein
LIQKFTPSPAPPANASAISPAINCPAGGRLRIFQEPVMSAALSIQFVIFLITSAVLLISVDWRIFAGVFFYGLARSTAEKVIKAEKTGSIHKILHRNV